MTTQEFSNTFDTLLNSYNIQAGFGEQASKLEITLDEYEKSVLLTQAQDIVVKTFFDARLNSQGAGFDDNEKRQIDFSSLINVKTLSSISTVDKNIQIEDKINGLLGTLLFKIVAEEGTDYWEVNVTVSDSPTTVGVYVSPKHSDYDDTTTINVNLNYNEVETAGNGNADLDAIVQVWNTIEFTEGDILQGFLKDYISATITYTTEEVLTDTEQVLINMLELHSVVDSDTFDDNGILYKLPDDVLFMLNEKLEIVTRGIKKKYVVIPLNYKEYDRHHSRPYSQPLKRQCWRLFQNIQGFDTLSEIIPIWNSIENGVSVVTYKVRYIRRPRPIILVNLPDDLEIDGKKNVTACELNEALHMEILNKAVELALTFKGGRQPVQTNQREQQ